MIFDLLSTDMRTSVQKKKKEKEKATYNMAECFFYWRVRPSIPPSVRLGMCRGWYFATRMPKVNTRPDTRPEVLRT